MSFSTKLSSKSISSITYVDGGRDPMRAWKLSSILAPASCKQTGAFYRTHVRSSLLLSVSHSLTHDLLELIVTAVTAGNSLYKLSKLDPCWWNQMFKQCWRWNEVEVELPTACKKLPQLATVFNSCQSWQQFLTAVKAGDNELTLADGIKYLSNIHVDMRLRVSCQQLVKAGDSL